MTIYTDGGCSGNPGPGAWAFVVLGGEGVLKGSEPIIDEKSGGENPTTNNRMELRAIIEAITYVLNNSSDKRVTIITDSQYAKNGLTQWMSNWKKNGWKTSDKKPVKNKDLWLTLDGLLKQVNVSFQWVKGHAGNMYNERCDTLVHNIHGGR